MYILEVVAFFILEIHHDKTKKNKDISFQILNCCWSFVDILETYKIVIFYCPIVSVPFL